MQVTTILVNKAPRVVIRPIDRKDLLRFLRNGNAFLTANATHPVEITYRDSTDSEVSLWETARELHRVWGGDDDQFFGLPLGEHFANHS